MSEAFTSINSRFARRSKRYHFTSYFAALCVAAILVLATVIATPTVIAAYSGSDDPQVHGQFGDQFGLTNALFSGMAFAGVVLALFLQTRDLQLQHQELEETRSELAKSANAQSATHAAMVDEAKRENLRRCREATMHYIGTRNIYHANWRVLEDHLYIDTLPPRTPLTSELLDKLWNHKPSKGAALAVIGYYETLATCVNSGVFDDALVDRLLGANITGHFILFKPLVDRCRTEWGSHRYFDEWEAMANRLITRRGGN